MKERPHQHQRQEASVPLAVLNTIRAASTAVQKAVRDAVVFVCTPIAYEFLRMREAAEECEREIAQSSLRGKEKGQRQVQLKQALQWLKAAEHRHYHDFDHSKPIIEIRHAFMDTLQKIRGERAFAA